MSLSLRQPELEANPAAGLGSLYASIFRLQFLRFFALPEPPLLSGRFYLLDISCIYILLRCSRPSHPTAQPPSLPTVTPH